MYAFERLDVWKLGREFVRDVYAASDEFPKREQFALCQQLTRAAVSITANIAEGCAKASKKEFSRYVEISFGSLCEVIAELYVALDRGYLEQENFDALYAKSERIGMLAQQTSWFSRKLMAKNCR